MKNYPLLIAIDGKGFDHQIVTAVDGNEVARVFAWESDSFEMAKVLAASTRMLNVLSEIASRYATVSERGAIEIVIETDLYNEINSAITEAKGKRP
jgi:glyoxylate carboligase